MDNDIASSHLSPKVPSNQHLGFCFSLKHISWFFNSEILAILQLADLTICSIFSFDSSLQHSLSYVKPAKPHIEGFTLK